MLNSELLKEAIADAKAVRATALANAKAALEENFRPRFEAMFADKLKEEAEEEEGCMDEVSAPNQVSGTGGEAKGPATKDVSKGQPHKGSTAKKNFKSIAVGGSEGAAGSKAPAAKQSIVKETSEEEDDVFNVDKEDGSVVEAGLTSEDLDEIIKELEMEVSGEEEGEVPEPVAPASEPAPEDPGTEVPPTDDVEPEVHAEPDGDEVPAAEVPPAPEPGAEVPPVEAPGSEDTDEINLDELLAALNEEAEEEEEEGTVEEGKLPPWLNKKDDDDKEEVDEICNNGVPKTGQTDKATVKGWPVKGSTASKNHNISGKGNIGSGNPSGHPTMEENSQLKSELNECINTIEFLRGQINEVNLLNAKLLYTNKLFKEFAGVLDDPYRMKIVESFDLTKSVREVKLAYALLAESLNFGTQMQKAKIVKTSPKQSVQRITEGLASAPVASTKPSAALITEGVNDMADRFKKLAGIRPPTKK
jgi:hypothetical protein